MKKYNPFKDASVYLLITLITFMALQSLVVVLHEFTHSTVAWLLGEMKSPADIVWGNPLTMTGWDEGVDYTRLFAQGKNIKAAVIGFSPLLMHTLVVGLCLFLMCGKWLVKRKWLFNTIYWFSIINFMELVAYVYMRSFAEHGDTGIFDRGTGLSPWWLFTIGSLFLSWGLFLLFSKVLPRTQILLAGENQLIKWMILIFSSGALFLWGSGIRVMAYVTGPQWMFGLIGIPAFMLTIVLCRPKV